MFTMQNEIMISPHIARGRRWQHLSDFFLCNFSNVSRPILKKLRNYLFIDHVI